MKQTETLCGRHGPEITDDGHECEPPARTNLQISGPSLSEILDAAKRQRREAVSAAVCRFYGRCQFCLRISTSRFNDDAYSS